MSPKDEQGDGDEHVLHGLLKRWVAQELASLAESDTGTADRRAERAPPPEGVAQRLRALYARLRESHGFQPGDLVRWKSGLKDRKRPLEGEPAIVLEVLDAPIHDSQADAGSAYFREPYDLRLGVLHQDGVLVAYWYNSQRFEPYPESKVAA